MNFSVEYTRLKDAAVLGGCKMSFLKKHFRALEEIWLLALLLAPCSHIDALMKTTSQVKPPTSVLVPIGLSYTCAIADCGRHGLKLVLSPSKVTVRVRC
jgi:hypothetical protein